MDNSSEENNEINHIYFLENQLQIFDQMVDDLWENIILKQIETGNLFKRLSRFDKDKFYNYMLNNSSIMKLLFNELNEYNKNLSKKCTGYI